MCTSCCLLMQLARMDVNYVIPLVETAAHFFLDCVLPVSNRCFCSFTKLYFFHPAIYDVSFIFIFLNIKWLYYKEN
jgi:hypothetical protein